jgi:molecular chaperone GrpE (heat shock protein)
MNDKWISMPKHQAPTVSETEVKNKARNYAGRINQALKSDNLKNAEETMENIRRLRQAGLDDGGEYSVENLAFKLLRARGQIEKLYNHIDKLQGTELSLKEQ